MPILMIIFRVIHIFSGMFWVGVAIFNMGYLQPTIRATGQEGQKVMRHLMRQTNFTTVSYAAATLTMLSGLIMYGILSGFQLSFLSSGYGLVLTIGGIAGVIAWLVVIILVRGIFAQMNTIGQQVQMQGSPPTPEQASQLQALGARLMSIGWANIVLLSVALLGMSAAQYAAF